MGVELSSFREAIQRAADEQRRLIEELEDRQCRVEVLERELNLMK
jgi:hypothetical protein